MTRVILASASPRRRDVLRHAGLEYEAEVSNVDEDNPHSLAPAELVVDLALRKARAVAAQNPDAVVIGADTLVQTEAGETLGKPADATQARRMIAQLAGQWHTVHTGIAVIAPGTELSDVSSSRVHMRALTEAQQDAYAQRPELTDLAGGYAIQGAAAVFIDRIEGDYLGVVGLPLSQLAALLEQVGVSFSPPPGPGVTSAMSLDSQSPNK